MVARITEKPPVVNPQSALSCTPYQICSSTLRAMYTVGDTLIYTPLQWLLHTAYYYLFGYGPGAQAPSSSSYNNQDLKGVWEETCAILKKGSYEYNGKTIDLKAFIDTSVKGTVRQNRFWNYNTAFKTRGEKTKIQVVNRDAVEAAIDLKRKGYNPAVLNPAHATKSGGGYKNGARAMEEDLCRRSCLAAAIDPSQGQQKNFYPLIGGDLLYSPSVPFFRAGRDQHYALLQKPETLSILTSAAVDLNPQHAGNEKHKNDLEVFKASTFRRCYAQLWKAASEGHDAVVLTAFGCGAFRNKPEVVANIYRQLINKNFQGVFKNITFAIIDDHNARQPHNPKGNFEPFREIFSA